MMSDTKEAGASGTFNFRFAPCFILIEVFEAISFWLDIDLQVIWEANENRSHSHVGKMPDFAI